MLVIDLSFPSMDENVIGIRALKFEKMTFSYLACLRNYM